jgi:hypothetical protein
MRESAGAINPTPGGFSTRITPSTGASAPSSEGDPAGRNHEEESR